MRLTIEQVRACAAGAFAKHGDDVIDTMTAICMAESGGDTEAINDNYPRFQPNPSSAYRYDYGLAQINSVHGYDSLRLLADPDYNLECALAIYEQQGFGAWSTYNAGAHLAFLPVPHPAAAAPEEPDVEVRTLDQAESIAAIESAGRSLGSALNDDGVTVVEVTSGLPADVAKYLPAGGHAYLFTTKD